jgi:hypothetical protein
LHGLGEISSDVLAAFGELLPAGGCMPMLQVTPRIMTPAGGDYFADEQVATWGADGFRGLPENPRASGYRTVGTPVTSSAHSYDFVVPVVQPTWNDRARMPVRLASSTRIGHRAAALKKAPLANRVACLRVEDGRHRRGHLLGVA